MELDSHADTCAFGGDCLVVQDTGTQVTVEPFAASLGSMTKVPVVTVAVAYDDPTTFNTFVLFFHQVLHVPSLTTHLLAPFQMRNHGVVIRECPLLHTEEECRRESTHTISVPEADLSMPLCLKGTMSGVTVRKPTWAEVNDTEQHEVTHVHMTSDAPWDPYDPIYDHQEEALRSDVSCPYTIPPRHLNSTQVRGQSAGPMFDTAYDQDNYIPGGDNAAAVMSLSRAKDDPTSVTADINSWNLDAQDFDPSDKLMQARPESKVIHSVQTLRDQSVHMALDVDSYAETLLNDSQLEGLAQQLASVSTVKKRKGFVDAESLAKNWRIGKEAARRTVEATTQRAVRDFTHTTGGRRLKPYSWMLRHPRIDSKVYTDTMFGQVKSLRETSVPRSIALHFIMSRLIQWRRSRRLTRV